MSLNERKTVVRNNVEAVWISLTISVRNTHSRRQQKVYGPLIAWRLNMSADTEYRILARLVSEKNISLQYFRRPKSSTFLLPTDPQSKIKSKSEILANLWMLSGYCCNTSHAFMKGLPSESNMVLASASHSHNTCLEVSSWHSLQVSSCIIPIPPWGENIGFSFGTCFFFLQRSPWRLFQ